MANTNKGFVRWNYADWRRQATVAEQIDRLIRHIEEVERYAFDTQNKGNRMMLQSGMLDRLQTQLDRLQAKQQLGTKLGQIGRTSRFRRGAGS